MSARSRSNPDSLKTDKRSADRKTMRLEVQGTSSTGKTVLATVSNLSRTGLLLEADAPFAMGDEILVDLPRSGPTSATVVWVGERLFGCQFTNPITRAALGAAQLQSPPETRQIEPHSAHTASTEPLNERLRRLRVEKGIAVADLAATLGVSKPSVWNWETGKARPRADNMEALAEAFDIRVSELLFGEPSSSDSDVDLRVNSFVADDPGGKRKNEVWLPDRAERNESRLAQLIAASKDQIAALAGTRPGKVTIILEF